MRHWLRSQLKTMSKKCSRKGLYEYLELEYSSISSGAEVLSIGAGGKVNELLESYAKKNNFNFVTFDIDESRGPNIVGDICDYDFGESKYDVVVMSEVLEHLYAPHLGIKSVYNILKPKGKLVLTTPFILPLHDRPYDYYRFTKYGLEFLLKEFRELKICERNSYFEAIDVLWYRLWQTGLRSARSICYLIIPIIFYLKRPLTYLLGKLIPTDAMTTGYHVTAIK